MLYQYFSPSLELAQEEVERLYDNRKVAGSIPGSSELSVEVSGARHPTLTAPDQLAVALRG